MISSPYRIQGDDGLPHQAQWIISQAGGSHHLSCVVGLAHDLTDVANSLSAAIMRLLTVADVVSVAVGDGTPCEVHADDMFLDARQEGAVAGRILAMVNAALLTGSATGVGIACEITDALADESDLVAAALLRPRDQPIKHANSHRPNHPLAWDVVLRPAPPPDAYLIRKEDPRFTDLLRGCGDLRTLVNEANPNDWYHVDDVLEAVQAIRDELADLTVESEAISIIAAGLGPKGVRYVEALGLRYGTDGESLATLDQASRIAGVTRERVRQVQSNFTIPSVPLLAPAADAAVRLLEEVLPATPDEIGEVFAASGISRLARWRAQTLTGVLALTGRAVLLKEMDGVVAFASDVGGAARVIPAARAASNLSGSADVTDVLVRLSESGQAPTVDFITRVLRTSQEVHWFADRRFWVDHAEGRNRLVNTSMRILSVIEPQTLDDMAGGVERNFRWRASTGGARFADITVPDFDDLRNFYHSHPAFAVDADDRVSAQAPLDMKHLGVEKLTMVKVFADTPTGMLTRNDLIEACVAAGMKASTVGVFLTYGECFKNYGHNVWGLRGLEPDESVVADAQQSARERGRQYDRRTMTGVTESGRPWLSVKITPTILYSGVITTDWLKGASNLQDLDVLDMTDGEHVGTLRQSGPFNYGYHPILRKNSARVGDVLRVLADPQDGICHAEVGGDELLSEPFDL